MTHLIATLDRFGENIGMAFQITDDILGIWGNPAITGKSAAVDILSKKKSLPIIIGLNSRDVSEALWAIYSQPRVHQVDVARVLALLDQIDAREQTNQIAQNFRQVAISALDQTKIKNRAMDHLREIADLMTNRVR
jgi:geranylgeranyl diphosphate synthase type I